QGFQVRGQGGISRYGDAGSYFISGLAGQNFGDGRGNVAVNVEYARQEQAWGGDRPWLARQDGLVVVDTDPAGALNGSDGLPDRRRAADSAEARALQRQSARPLRSITGTCSVRRGEVLAHGLDRRRRQRPGLFLRYDDG